MEVVELTHLAKTHNVVHLTLFHSVSNIPSLLASLRAGAPDESLPKSITTEILSQYAFLDASVIVSRKHVLNAVMEALTRREMGDMKTRSWSTELMGVLWPGGNVSNRSKTALRDGTMWITSAHATLRDRFPTRSSTSVSDPKHPRSSSFA